MTTINNSIWINAGEASGDMHGARLAKELMERDPGLKVMGMGGSAMEKAGCDIRYPMQLISLVGLTEVLPKLPRLLRLFGQIGDILKAERPKAIILIDCPDFNFRLVKIARKLDIPVYYYITPQIWAWRSGRVHFLRKHVRRVICILPFEKAFYEKFGVEVDYVGNPLMDVLPLETLDTIAVDENRIGLLPGSRTKEVSTLLPVFAETAKRLQKDHPNLKYVMVRAPGMEKDLLLSHWPGDIPVEIVEPDARYETFRSCKFIMAASGTVTLETALIGTPVLVAYKMSALSAFIGRLLINVEFASLPNLIVDREIYPEFIQERADPEIMAHAARKWLDDTDAYAGVKRELIELRTMVGNPGAALRAAKIIVEDLIELGV